MKASAPAGRRLPGVSLLLSLPALVLALAPGWAGRLELDWRAVAEGEVWRVVTGHWTHASTEQLVWDLGAFFVLAAACELRDDPNGRRRLLAAVGLAALAVPLTLWLVLPGVERYRGLSAIDSALFVLLAVLFLRDELAAGRPEGWWGGLALAAFLGKLGWEAATGGTLFAPAAGGAVPLPLAHLAGGLCGLAAACLPSSGRFWGGIIPADGRCAPAGFCALMRKLS
jgi:rhomboid family GlyGly-CTERM serine protease